jgi:hypothetical protein
MAKYKVEFYGWEMEAQGYSLSDEQVEQVRELMEDNGYDELWEIRSEMEDIGIDIWDEGDLFHVSKPHYNDTFWGKVFDEDGNVVLEIDYKDLGDMYDYIGDDDKIEELYPYENYIALPEFLDGTYNVLLVVDENKGGLFECSFESDELPKTSDFSLMGGTVETPEGDWDFISRVFFKDIELEPEDYLDNYGKAATLEIYTIGGKTIG